MVQSLFSDCADGFVLTMVAADRRPLKQRSGGTWIAIPGLAERALVRRSQTGLRTGWLTRVLGGSDATLTTLGACGSVLRSSPYNSTVANVRPSGPIPRASVTPLTRQ